MDTQLITHQPKMEVILSVENLISYFLSSSEEKKWQGQMMFDMMKEQDPNSLALVLAQLVGASNSHDIYFREMCAFFLYRLLTDDKYHIWNNNLSVSTQSTLKSILLIHINLEECSGSIMEMLCSTVSSLCNTSNNWPELLHFLQECITSNSNRLKESFFYIFADLAPERCKKLFPDVMTLLSFFLKTMNDDTLTFYMRGAALSAAINFIQCLSSLNELTRVQSLYPAMMRTLDDALSKDDWNSTQYRLQRYIKLAKNEARFFRINIVDVVNTMFEIAENMKMEERIRHLALEFLLTLVEAKEKTPGMMKKVPRFTHSYFAMLLNLLLDVKDEPSWHSADNCLYWESDSLKIGCEYLKRFSNALGGKTVAHIAIEQLDAYLAAPEWEKRHAALIALAHVSEGCSKVVIKYYLEQVVSMVLHSSQDPHPRVRWAAIRSIVGLSIDLSPDLQEQHHIQVVPTLAAAMDDFEHPRVQTSAAAAVQNFCIFALNPDNLLPYLDAILNKLLVLLQNDNQMVQQVAIDALTAVAESSKEHFQNYYGFIMPHLKTITLIANDKSNHMLHSVALGCISMIGRVVGREKFRDDIKQVTELLKSSQESQRKEFGSLVHILQAWARIRSCIGKDFLPYMSTVIPLLVTCAQVQPNNIIDGSNKSGIYKVKFGDEMIYANRSDFLDVKALACCQFGWCASTLGEDFYPWISQATSTLVPLLKFYMSSDVRIKASTALYRVLKSARLAVEKGIVQGKSDSYFKQLSCDIILAFGDALDTESEAKACVGILCSLLECLEICGPLLSEDLFPRIVDLIKHVIAKSSWRGEELTEREKSEDFDVEEAELMREDIEQEENIFVNVGYILRRLVETFNTAFLPFLDELLSYLIPTRGKDAESFTGILIFNGLVKQCGEAALKYYNIFLPFLLESSNGENTANRQNALYGLGLCAKYGISVFKPFVGEALPRINKVIMHLHAHQPKNEWAFDNAVSALGKICQFHRESINSAQIIPAWLNCLPIKGDIDEAKDVHDQLCLMVERLDMDLLGPNYEHFPKIISVFAEVLCAGKNLATEETLNRMINVLRNLQKIIPCDTWGSAWLLLLPQQEMELEFVLSPEEDANFST